MNTTLILLATASFFLSATIAYALWSRLRVLLLEADLISLLIGLRSRASEFGALEDPDYRQAYRYLWAMMVLGRELSPPLMLHLRQLAHDAGTDALCPEPENPDMRRAVRQTQERMLNRLVRYLNYESASGIARALWHKLTAPENQRVSEGQAEPSRWLDQYDSLPKAVEEYSRYRALARH